MKPWRHFSQLSVVSAHFPLLLSLYRHFIDRIVYLFEVVFLTVQCFRSKMKRFFDFITPSSLKQIRLTDNIDNTTAESTRKDGKWKFIVCFKTYFMVLVLFLVYFSFWNTCCSYTQCYSWRRQTNIATNTSTPCKPQSVQTCGRFNPSFSDTITRT